MTFLEPNREIWESKYCVTWYITMIICRWQAYVQLQLHGASSQKRLSGVPSEATLEQLMA